MKVWVKRLRNSGVQKVVTYHSSFEYFLDRFQLQVTGLIEEKPGIPPSAKHILKIDSKNEKQSERMYFNVQIL